MARYGQSASDAMRRRLEAAAKADTCRPPLFSPLVSETRNEMQVVDERLLADEWETIATPEPEIVAHLFGLYGKATEKTKATEATGGTEEAEGAKRSLKSLSSLRSLEGGSNG